MRLNGIGRDGTLKSFFENRERLIPRMLFSVITGLCLVACLVMVGLTLRGKTVAVVNGEKISRDKLYEAMYEQGGRETLDQVITVMLIEQEGKKRGVVISDNEIKDEITKMVDENFDGERELFDETLEQHGIDLKTIEQNFRVDLVVRKIAAEGLEFTEKELQEHFENNRIRYDEPEKVEARHILVKTAEEAQEVLVLLQNGTDFGELAQERSEDTVSGAEGGGLGFFSRGEMTPAFEEAAFALEKGELSDPVETKYGFHVIELLNRKSGRAVAFAEVKEHVRADMNEAKLPELIRELVASLWENANVVYR